jgi:hypothetical protein
MDKYIGEAVNVAISLLSPSHPISCCRQLKLSLFCGLLPDDVGSAGRFHPRYARRKAACPETRRDLYVSLSRQGLPISYQHTHHVTVYHHHKKVFFHSTTAQHTTTPAQHPRLSPPPRPLSRQSPEDTPPSYPKYRQRKRDLVKMSKMWEVDPETRSKLGEIAKTNENNRCIDCGAPSPQWVC